MCGQTSTDPRLYRGRNISVYYGFVADTMIHMLTTDGNLFALEESRGYDTLVLQVFA